MKTQAQQAIENALQFEVKKDGLTQRQNGDWVLRLTVQAIDMHQRITTADMGTRFWCSLIELNDDETPVDHKAMDRDKWRDLGPAKQAGMRCKEPIFWAYLTEEYTGRDDPVVNEDDAAEFVRNHCGVASRSDFGKPGYHDNRLRWHELDNAYQAWKARENG